MAVVCGGCAFHPSSAPPLATNAANEDNHVEDDDDDDDASAIQVAIVSTIADASITVTSSSLSHSDVASASMSSQPATTTLIKKSIMLNNKMDIDLTLPHDHSLSMSPSSTPPHSITSSNRRLGHTTFNISCVAPFCLHQ